MSMVSTEYCDVAAATVAVQAGGGSAVAGPLHAAKLHIFTNVPTLGKETAVSDLTAPTSTALAGQTITWSSPRRDAAGDIVVESGLMSFALGSSDPSVAITGAAVTDSAGTNLLMAGLFAAPANLLDSLTSLNLLIQYNAADPQLSQLVIVD